MSVRTLQATFARGELSPRLHGRPDVEHYAMSLATCKNWIVMRQGGLTRRPGFKFIHGLRSSAELGRLVKFEFNAEQAYAVLFNNLFIRFLTSGGIVTQTAQNISGITKANPGVLTYVGADTFANGDRVYVSGVVGMVEVNNRTFTVANLNAGANTFELSGIDTTTYTTYASAGTVAEHVEIASPYLAADLASLQFAQSGDTLYITHPSYAPRKLVRSSETSWALSIIAFDDGPYLDEATSGTIMVPAETGAVHPDMTGLTTPSGTVANSEAAADAWEAFDRVNTTSVDWVTGSGWLSYDFAGAATKICDAYWIMAGRVVATGGAPGPGGSWSFDGYDGTNWHTLDAHQDEGSWAPGEIRYYEFENTGAYQSYRLYTKGADGADDNFGITETGWHESGDSQTAFNLTASAVTGINSGAGFATTDPNGTIRLMGEDGRWRWAYIVARTSTTVVTIRLYGQSLIDITGITHWQMSAWRATTGFPAAVCFYENRLASAATDTEPRKVWMSKSASYEDFGTSAPIQDNDGINAEMTGGQLNRIVWMEPLSDLVVATPGAIHIVGPNDGGSPLSSTNIKQRPQSSVGASTIQPIVSGHTLIYTDRYKKRIHEFAYDYNVNGYVSRELSILSDHLFDSGVIANTFQQQPHNLAFYPCNDGTVPTLTFQKDQNIAGWTKTVVAGGGTADAVVESIVSIPSSGGDMVYAIVKRTIDSGTVRYVEVMSDFYETADTLAAAVFLDSAITYSGVAASSVSGAYHLRLETVGVFADGLDIGDAVVSALGVVTLASVTARTGITLPSTATTITIGKRYTSYAKTLRAPQTGNADGAGLGRKMRVNGAMADLMDTGHLSLGTLEGSRDAAYRTWDTARTAPATLVTGMKNVPLNDSHRNEGVLVMSTDYAYPATIRALEVDIDGEP